MDEEMDEEVKHTGNQLEFTESKLIVYKFLCHNRLIYRVTMDNLLAKHKVLTDAILSDTVLQLITSISFELKHHAPYIWDKYEYMCIEKVTGMVSKMGKRLQEAYVEIITDKYLELNTVAVDELIQLHSRILLNENIDTCVNVYDGAVSNLCAGVDLSHPLIQNKESATVFVRAHITKWFVDKTSKVVEENKSRRLDKQVTELVHRHMDDITNLVQRHDYKGCKKLATNINTLSTHVPNFDVFFTKLIALVQSEYKRIETERRTIYKLHVIKPHIDSQSTTTPVVTPLVVVSTTNNAEIDEQKRLLEEARMREEKIQEQIKKDNEAARLAKQQKKRTAVNQPHNSRYKLIHKFKDQGFGFPTNHIIPVEKKEDVVDVVQVKHQCKSPVSNVNHPRINDSHLIPLERKAIDLSYNLVQPPVSSSTSQIQKLLIMDVIDDVLPAAPGGVPVSSTSASSSTSQEHLFTHHEKRGKAKHVAKKNLFKFLHSRE